MKSTNLADEVNEFFGDQYRLRSLRQRAEQQHALAPTEQEEVNVITAHWKHHPAFYRGVREELEVLKQYIASPLSPSPIYSARTPSGLPPASQPAAIPRHENRTRAPEKKNPKNVISLPLKELSPKNYFSSSQAEAEHRRIVSEEQKFEAALENIVDHHLNGTMDFGRQCSIELIAGYLSGLFGKELYFDSLLSLVQQYAIADVPIINDSRKIIGRTGFNLSFFGDPGTGKTFAIKDMILGNPDAGIPAHGLIGKNRYCGSITAARFVRMAEAYRDHKFNFIVPEFDDWFRYQGMVNTLKAAMEGGQIEYETNNETIGPYQFKSFFSVNYNTKVSAQDYQTTIGDPHFKAIEDRMLNNLHRMTKERYEALAHSREKLEKGELNMSLAEQIQRQVMLLYAIQTSHPKVTENFPALAVMATTEFYDKLARARELILEPAEHGDSLVHFSPRLERRALQLAAAATLPSYFQQCSSDQRPEYLCLDSSAVKYAMTFFIREAAVRSRKELNMAMILQELWGASNGI